MVEVGVGVESQELELVRRLGGEVVFACFHVLGIAIAWTLIHFRARLPRFISRWQPIVLFIASVLVADCAAYALILVAGADDGHMATALLAGSLVGVGALVSAYKSSAPQSLFWDAETPAQAAAAPTLAGHALILTGCTVAVWLAFKLPFR